MKSKVLLVLCGIGTQVFGSTPSDVTEIGVNRIQPVENYCVWRYAEHASYPVFGYQLKQGARIRYECQNDQIRSWIGEETPRIAIWKNNPAILRTFNGDLVSALCDKDQFDTYMEEGFYANAYRMATTNNQGDLWRRQAFARAKDKIEDLVWKGVSRNDTTFTTRAAEIVTSFRDTPVHDQLQTLYTETQTRAQTRFNELLANPQAAFLPEALRGEYVLRVLESNS